MVRDAPGCITNLINVSVADGPVITTTVSKTDALCNGGATGTITVAQPVLGVAPFQYSLDGVIWQASNSFTGLVAGSYTVFIAPVMVARVLNQLLSQNQRHLLLQHQQYLLYVMARIMVLLMCLRLAVHLLTCFLLMGVPAGKGQYF